MTLLLLAAFLLLLVGVAPAPGVAHAATPTAADARWTAFRGWRPPTSTGPWTVVSNRELSDSTLNLWSDVTPCRRGFARTWQNPIGDRVSVTVADCRKVDAAARYQWLRWNRSKNRQLAGEEVLGTSRELDGIRGATVSRYFAQGAFSVVVGANRVGCADEAEPCLAASGAMVMSLVDHRTAVVEAEDPRSRLGGALDRWVPLPPAEWTLVSSRPLTGLCARAGASRWVADDLSLTARTGVCANNVEVDRLFAEYWPVGESSLPTDDAQDPVQGDRTDASGTRTVTTAWSDGNRWYELDLACAAVVAKRCPALLTVAQEGVQTANWQGLDDPTVPDSRVVIAPTVEALTIGPLLLIGVLPVLVGRTRSGGWFASRSDRFTSVVPRARASRRRRRRRAVVTSGAVAGTSAALLLITAVVPLPGPVGVALLLLGPLAVSVVWSVRRWRPEAEPFGAQLLRVIAATLVVEATGVVVLATVATIIDLQVTRETLSTVRLEELGGSAAFPALVAVLSLAADVLLYGFGVPALVGVLIGVLLGFWIPIVVAMVVDRAGRGMLPTAHVAPPLVQDPSRVRRLRRAPEGAIWPSEVLLAFRTIRFGSLLDEALRPIADRVDGDPSNRINVVIIGDEDPPFGIVGPLLVVLPPGRRRQVIEAWRRWRGAAAHGAEPFASLRSADLSDGVQVLVWTPQLGWCAWGSTRRDAESYRLSLAAAVTALEVPPAMAPREPEHAAELVS